MQGRWHLISASVLEFEIKKAEDGNTPRIIWKKDSLLSLHPACWPSRLCSGTASGVVPELHRSAPPFEG
jgi:hypothetical protein